MSHTDAQVASWVLLAIGIALLVAFLVLESSGCAARPVVASDGFGVSGTFDRPRRRRVYPDGGAR